LKGYTKHAPDQGPGGYFVPSNIGERQSAESLQASAFSSQPPDLPEQTCQSVDPEPISVFDDPAWQSRVGRISVHDLPVSPKST
jgi:hypothetical protein